MGWYADRYGDAEDALDELLDEFQSDEESFYDGPDDYHDRYGNHWKRGTGQWYDRDGNSHGCETPEEKLRPEDIYEAEEEEEREDEVFAATDNTLWGAIGHLENRMINPKWAVRAMEELRSHITVDSPIEYAMQPMQQQHCRKCFQRRAATSGIGRSFGYSSARCECTQEAREQADKELQAEAEEREARRAEALSLPTCGADPILATFARAALSIFEDAHLFEDVGENNAFALEIKAAEVLHSLMAEESTLGLYHFRTCRATETHPEYVVDVTKARARALLAGYLIERHMSGIQSLAASLRGETDSTAQQTADVLRGVMCAGAYAAGTLGAVHWVGHACARTTGSALPQLCLALIAEELQRPLVAIVRHTDVIANAMHTLKCLELQQASKWLKRVESYNGAHPFELDKSALNGHSMTAATAQLLGCVAWHPIAAQASIAKLSAVSAPKVLICAMQRWKVPEVPIHQFAGYGYCEDSYRRQEEKRHRDAATIVWAAQAAVLAAIEGMSSRECGRDQLLGANGIAACVSLLEAAASWSEPRPAVVRPALVTLRNLCAAGVPLGDSRVGMLQLVAERAGARHQMAPLAQQVLAHLSRDEVAVAVWLLNEVKAVEAVVAAREQERQRKEQEEERQRKQRIRQEEERRRQEEWEREWKIEKERRAAAEAAAQAEQMRQNEEKRQRQQAEREAAQRREAGRKPCERSWVALTDAERACAIRLGFDQRSWVHDDWSHVRTPWDIDEQGSADALALGFTASSWHGREVRAPPINSAPIGSKRPHSQIASSSGAPSSGVGADPCVCTVCNKRLKTAAGMLDHRFAVHGVKKG